MDYIFSPGEDKLNKIKEYKDYRGDSDLVLLVQLSNASDTYDRARAYNNFKEQHKNESNFKRYDSKF